MQLLSSLILWLFSTVFSIKSINPPPPPSSPYLPKIQAVFPSATHTFTTGQDALALIVTLSNPSQATNPSFYHHMFPLCQQLQATSVYLVIFESVDKSVLRRADCHQAVSKYTSTGSLSYALWQLSYRSPDELELVGRMYSAPSYQDSIRIGESLVAKYPSAPNNYDLGFWHYMRSSELQGSVQSETHYQQAKKYYKQALDLDPDFAPAHASFAYTLADSEGITPEVDQHFDKAKQLDPGWSFAWMNQGLTYAYRGRKSEGYQLLRQAVMTNPKFPDQSRVVENFLCLSRSLKKAEPADFYTTYGINKSQPLSFCPF